jgi:hypothetical protein
VEELVSEAARTGDQRLSARATRKFQRLFVACVDTAAKELIHATLEKFASINESLGVEEKLQSKAFILSPERVSFHEFFYEEVIATTPPLSALQ